MWNIGCAFTYRKRTFNFAMMLTCLLLWFDLLHCFKATSFGGEACLWAACAPHANVQCGAGRPFTWCSHFWLDKSFLLFFFLVLLSCLKELLHFYSDCCYVDREGSSKWHFVLPKIKRGFWAMPWKDVRRVQSQTWVTHASNSSQCKNQSLKQFRKKKKWILKPAYSVSVIHPPSHPYLSAAWCWPWPGFRCQMRRALFCGVALWFLPPMLALTPF